MKLIELFFYLEEIALKEETAFTLQYKQDRKEAIAEAEHLEIKAEAFNRIRKYCTEELWNQMWEEAKEAMKKKS